MNLKKWLDEIIDNINEFLDQYDFLEVDDELVDYLDELREHFHVIKHKCKEYSLYYLTKNPNLTLEDIYSR